MVLQTAAQGDGIWVESVERLGSNYCRVLQKAVRSSLEGVLQSAIEQQKTEVRRHFDDAQDKLRDLAQGCWLEK